MEIHTFDNVDIPLIGQLDHQIGQVMRDHLGIMSFAFAQFRRIHSLDTDTVGMEGHVIAGAFHHIAALPCKKVDLMPCRLQRGHDVMKIDTNPTTGEEWSLR